MLKKLLVINTKDCLASNKPEYDAIAKSYDVKRLIDEGYIKITPRLEMPEHEDVQTYIFITFDNFTQSANPKFRDCTISFSVLSHPQYWDIGDFTLRPLKIVGIIDGILNESRLSGIGQLHFSICGEHALDEELGGYSIIYDAVHGSDDYINDDWHNPVDLQ